MNQIHVSFLNLDKLNGIETFRISITATSDHSLMTKDSRIKSIFSIRKFIQWKFWVKPSYREKIFC